MDNQTCRRTYQTLKSERSNIEGIWSVIERFIWPFRGDMFQAHGSESEIRWSRGEIYDSTAIEANGNLSASIQGAIVPSGVQWFDLTFSEGALRNSNPANVWLEECARRVYYAIQLSNFNLEAGELLSDLTSFGTAAMAGEMVGSDLDMKGFNYQSIPVRECFFETDYKGDVIRFFRELNWTPLQFLSKFGDKCPKDIQDKANEGKVDRQKLIFCIYPRPGADNADTSKPLAPQLRPFGYKYILLKDASLLGEEGGYFEMPVFIPKWRKSVGSKFGYSPGMIALPDVLTANKEIQLIFRAGEKAVDPPIIVPDRGLLSDLDLSAAGLTVARDPAAVKTLESKQRLDFAQLLLGDIRDSINSKFFSDQLKLRDADRMTTVEVQMRYEQMQRLFGPTLGRIQSDWLDNLIQVTFNSMYRAGKLPAPPQEVLKYNPTIDVRYLGPMARAQKLDSVASIERWMGQMGGMLEIYPELRDLAKAEDVGRETGRLLNVPTHLIRSKAEMLALKKQREKQQQEMQALAMAKEGSETVRNLGGLEAIQGGAGGQGQGQNAAGAQAA